jgi:hypothetical protein
MSLSTTDTTERIKDRVRKLLAVSVDDAATQGEIDNAIRFAKIIMAKHQLSEDEIPTDDPSAVKTVEFARTYAQSVGVHLTDWEMDLARFISAFVGTVSWYRNGGHATRKNSLGLAVFDKKGDPQRCRTVVFYGPQEDVELAQELQTDLSITIASMARARYGGPHRGSGREYAEGFVEGLREANTRARKEIQSNDEGRALVVQSDKRNSLVRVDGRKWLKDVVGIRFGGSIPGSSSYVRDPNARNTGVADGRKTTVSRNVTRKIAAQ